MAPRKRKKKKTTQRKSGSGRFQSMLLGLFAGIAIAVVAWWQLGQPAPPVIETPPETEVSEQTAAPAVVIKELEATGKDFEFYDVLAEQEILIHDSRRRDTRDRTAARIAEVTESGSYRLQAGSFTNIEDAERLKARLALQGMQADIEAATVREQRYFRVIIGPLTDTAIVNEYQRRLADANIDFILGRRAP